MFKFKLMPKAPREASLARRLLGPLSLPKMRSLCEDTLPGSTLVFFLIVYDSSLLSDSMWFKPKTKSKLSNNLLILY